MQHGKRYAVSLKTDDLAEAVKKINEIRAGVAFARWERAEPVTDRSNENGRGLFINCPKTGQKTYAPQNGQEAGCRPLQVFEGLRD
jgi:hypothetical protein